ncbi:AAA family ATPase [Desulfococcaceae bacterium HSG7]|nr:AAA family ATPase [Desulfococcaceae bacterium HSG9]MDM8553923.1 AAA family ATPase [Desulfococcaceae bacterium HSG7]
MIISCKNCASKFNVNETFIRESGSRVRCSLCKRVFTIQRPSTTKDKVIQKEIAQIKKEPSPVLKHPCRIISISNQKGGVSKTTTCLNLGASLAMLNWRVLMIDFDVQASLTGALGYQNTRSFYDVIHSDYDFSSCILNTKYARLDLLPSDENMILLDRRYFFDRAGANFFEYMLKDRLADLVGGRLKNKYDYILIDTPPSVGYFVLNSLTAAHFIIIPCQSEYLSARGVGQTVKLINRVKRNTNPQVQARILVTMYDPDCTASKLVVSKLKGSYRGMTFKTVINHDVKIRESQIMKEPVYYYDKHSQAALQYFALAKEIGGKF